MEFNTANDVFEFYYKKISNEGIEFSNTKALFNQGFTILKPLDNNINAEFRNWNLEYAIAEHKWYESGDRNIKAIGDIYGKIPAIWLRMADENGDVNSNYGWQWKRNNQLLNVINILKTNKDTRQAAISIYDAKEMHTYYYDTPCTYAVQFTIIDNKLNMAVLMRSNDLWFGFCNDQYCFSKLQEHVASELKIEVGTYFHFASNLHIYNNFLNKNK
jgi:thymidylate synthase